MGEPFRAERGEDRPPNLWFVGADKNGDGALSKAEFENDAARFFAILDRNHDGEINPDDIEYYETEMVPEIRVMEAPGGRGGRSDPGPGGGGGGRRGGGSSGGGGMHGGGGHGGGPGGGGMHSGGDTGSGPGPGASDQQPRAFRRGAARYSYLAYPEPVTAADTNFNRGVSSAEFRAAADERFRLLDTNGDGAITRDELAMRMGPRGTGRGGHD
jgi:hypothetical protein